MFTHNGTVTMGSSLRYIALVVLMSAPNFTAHAQDENSAFFESPNLGSDIKQQEPIPLDLIASNENPLPAGNGTAYQGREIYVEKCAACHGEDGKGGPANQPLVGGNIHSSESPLRTVGSFWPHATTLFDYIRRAMPANAPKSLSDTEVYQVVAYVLYMNGLIDQYAIINADSLPLLTMPNAEGFIDMSK